ncbi:MAG TPA: HAD-IA family hydrolase [Dehalococcoidia bacterium]|nr:HAD-IA family hydrolase [Dehalococcoidia bacterium]
MTLTTNAIKAVIFDVDGVLLDSRAANIVFYRDFLQRHGYDGLSEDVLAHGHHMNLYDAIAFMTGAPGERVKELWQEARALEGYPNHLLRLPDGCRTSLEGLASTYPLAIVTARIREGIDHFFTFSGLRSLFTIAVGYEDYTRPKPDAEPLLVACQRLSVEPQHAVYIGDAPSDQACARAAGVHFIAYGDGIAGAEHVIAGFGELESALGRLRS